MTWLAAVLLGVVQGLTEFLPVSSSAHLILARAFFGWDASVETPFGLPFDVALHVGTLVAVVVFFWRDILAMIRAIPRVFDPHAAQDARRIRLVIAGTVPIVIVGLLFADFIESHTRTPAVAATALLVGAGLLFAIEHLTPHNQREESLTMGGAFVIGMAQSAALVPGVSRSGITIATAMALGLERASAARFTFLMSIPAILAAAAREALELRHATLTRGDWAFFALGTATSAIVGYLTVRFFVGFLVGHRLDVFAWYRIALALVTFAWLATR